mmetsp:Transcript_6390/g.5622  ORF Transcript_6390/g.5622 Transcript_6390/m.5622 type:complete len:718 (-) Transcript_6390:206-2359(-)
MNKLILILFILINITSAPSTLNQYNHHLQTKYDELVKTTEGQKLEHENLLQETRNKLEGDIQTLEKNYQEMLKQKNEMELNLHEEQEKLEKAENGLLELTYQFDVLNVNKSRVEDDLKMETLKLEQTMVELKEKIDKFKRAKSTLLLTIKTQKLESATERQNNHLTLNILKEQMKQLNGELAEMEEAKKAAEKAVSLHEKQMKAAQLLDEMDEDPDDEYEEYDDINVELSHVTAETELSAVDEPNLKKRNCGSRNMSRLPFHNYTSGDLTERDEETSVYIRDDIDNHGRLITLSPIITSINVNKKPGHIIYTSGDGDVTPPSLDLKTDPIRSMIEEKGIGNENINENKDKLNVEHHVKMSTNLSLASNFDYENQPIPIPADNDKNKDFNIINNSKSANDAFKPCLHGSFSNYDSKYKGYHIAKKHLFMLENMYFNQKDIHRYSKVPKFDHDQEFTITHPQDLSVVDYDVDDKKQRPKIDMNMNIDDNNKDNSDNDLYPYLCGKRKLMVSNNSIEVKDIDARSDGSGRSSNIPTPIMTDFEEDDEEFPDSDDHKYDTIIIKSSTHEFDDEPVIDWTSLTINPTDQRLYPGQQEEINDKRFEQTMGEFNDTSREFRKEPTGTLVQLDGIRHQYDIAVGPNIDLLPKLSSRVHPIDDDTKEDMNIANHAPLLLTTPTTLNNRIRSKSRDHRDDDGNQMYTSPLTLKVSSQGVHNKRYSIV